MAPAVSARDLFSVEPADLAVGYGQHDHAPHAVFQAALPAFFLDLSHGNRGGLGNRLANKPAIDLLVRRQCRLVSQQNLQEAEMRDVPAQDKQANGKWR
jgi:hypothetical protein